MGDLETILVDFEADGLPGEWVLKMLVSAWGKFPELPTLDMPQNSYLYLLLEENLGMSLKDLIDSRVLHLTSNLITSFQFKRFWIITWRV